MDHLLAGSAGFAAQRSGSDSLAVVLIQTRIKPRNHFWLRSLDDVVGDHGIDVATESTMA